MKKLAIVLLIAVVTSFAGCSKGKTNEAPGTNEKKMQENSPKNDNMGDINQSVQQGKKDVQKLYMDLESNFKQQTGNFQKDSWEKFVAEFNRVKDNVKKTVTENVYLNDAIANLENLYEEYNKALRDNTQIGKEKIQEIKNKIEENLKKIK